MFGAKRLKGVLTVAACLVLGGSTLRADLVAHWAFDGDAKDAASGTAGTTSGNAIVDFNDDGTLDLTDAVGISTGSSKVENRTPSAWSARFSRAVTRFASRRMKHGFAEKGERA